VKVVGIAGTAKNTGKTTALTALLAEAEHRNIVLGLTSIGYDGEFRDNITGLPKPRIHCQTGIYVAVAERCLTAGTCRVEVLERTPVQTPLGGIVIGVVTEPGLLVVAGPNKTRELRLVLAGLRRHGCELVFVDGALNRISPMVETNGIILATGAARSPHLDNLAREAGVFDRLLSRQAEQAGWQGDKIIISDGSNCMRLSTGSLLSAGQIDEIAAAFSPATKYVYIPGAADNAVLRRLVQTLDKALKGVDFVFPNVINLIVGGEPPAVQATIEAIESRGGRILFQHRVPLLAVTVNPFYPAYRRESNRYRPAAVDPDELHAKVSGAVSVPVVDVKREGAGTLFAALSRRLL